MEIIKEKFDFDGKTLDYYPLKQLESRYNIDNLPYSLKILLENVLRNYDNKDINEKSIDNIASMKTGYC